MTYSRGQEQFAVWVWITLMVIVGVTAVSHTARAVRDIFRLGLSKGTVSILLLVAGIALVSLSNATATLLFTLFPSRSGKAPRWFLIALGIGVVMSILGAAGLFK